MYNGGGHGTAVSSQPAGDEYLGTSGGGGGGASDIYISQKGVSTRYIQDDEYIHASRREWLHTSTYFANIHTYLRTNI